MIRKIAFALYMLLALLLLVAAVLQFAWLQNSQLYVLMYIQLVLALIMYPPSRKQKSDPISLALVAMVLFSTVNLFFIKNFEDTLIITTLFVGMLGYGGYAKTVLHLW